MKNELRWLRATCNQLLEVSIGRSIFREEDHADVPSAKSANIAGGFLSKILFPAKQQDCHRSKTIRTVLPAYRNGGSRNNMCLNSRTAQWLPSIRSSTSQCTRRQPQRFIWRITS